MIGALAGPSAYTLACFYPYGQKGYEWLASDRVIRLSTVICLGHLLFFSSLWLFKGGGDLSRIEVDRSSIPC